MTQRGGHQRWYTASTNSCINLIHQEKCRRPFGYGHGSDYVRTSEARFELKETSSTLFPVLTHRLWHAASVQGTPLGLSIILGLGKLRWNQNLVSPVCRSALSEQRGVQVLALLTGRQNWHYTAKSTQHEWLGWCVSNPSPHSAAYFTASLQLNRVFRDGSTAFYYSKRCLGVTTEPSVWRQAQSWNPLLQPLLWTKRENVCSDSITKLTSNYFRAGVALEVQRNKKLSLRVHFC